MSREGLRDVLPDDRSAREQGREYLRESSALERLREKIDRCVKGAVSLTEFIRRLEREGVRVVPSMQQSGRLNGFTYDIEGTRVKGSSLGRSYTAYGLQTRKGVRYDPAADNPYLQALALQARGARVAEPRVPGRLGSPDRGRERPNRNLDGITSFQRETMREIGIFRALRASDLVRVRYDGNVKAWVQDLKILFNRGLAEQRSIVVKGFRGPRSLSVVVLTKKGKELLKRAERDPERKAQALYAGFVKPKEIAHDTAIYRMYEVEAARIEKAGGVIRRVVLDYELKKKVYSPLVKARKESALAYARKQTEVARENSLRIVDGKIPLPDLRIEYDTARGERTKVDLELATADYRGEHLRSKEQAGFKVFMESALGSNGGSSGRYPALEEDHLESILYF